MRIRIRLADSDRARLGCPEWLEVDLFSVSMREAVQLQKGVLLDGVLVAFDNPAQWRIALNGVPVTNDQGQPVMVPVTDDEGAPVLEDGQPQEKQKRRTDYGAWAVLVWLALRRTGAAPNLADLDFDFDGMRWEIAADPDDDAEPSPDGSGKDESSPEMTS